MLAEAVLVFSKIVATSAKSSPCYNKHIVSKVQNLPKITSCQSACYKDKFFERAFAEKS